MRRFIGFALLLLFSAPFGLSVIGCAKKGAPVEYCNSGDSGPIIGQVAQIVLSPSLATTGESLNYGQIGQGLSASAEDCKGNSVSVSRYTYASTSSFSANAVPGSFFADINPGTGQVCAGTWNRNVGGGIQDYTQCTAPASPTNYVPVVVTPGSSPYTYVAAAAGTLTVAGGSVSSIVLTPVVPPSKTTPYPYTSGVFTLNIGDAVTITYTSVPTVNFFSANALSPVNVPPPTISPSTYLYTAMAAGTVTVQANSGVVFFIIVTHGGVAALQSSTSGSFAVSAGDTVAVNYTVAPPVTFTGTSGTTTALTVAPSIPSTFLYTATTAGTASIPASSTGVASVLITHNSVLALQTSATGNFAVSAGDTVTVNYTTAPAFSFTAKGGSAVAVAVAPTNESYFAYTSALGGTLALGGGVIPALVITHNGVPTPQSSTSGLFALSAGDSAAMVYTATPTVGFNPYGAVAFVTATANGAVSNAIPVYVHPTATGVVLGGASTSCVAGQSGGTDCCPNVTTGAALTAPVYSGTGCLSQNTTGQLVARVYTGGNTSPANDISCQVGHLFYGTQNASNVVTIDDTGIATANQPGSTEITATIAQSSTSTNAGFFSTCPPATIALTVSGTAATSATLPINNTLPLTAAVYDTNNALITGLSLEFTSTEPQTIPGASAITPIYPGSAQITAVCQPATCNPAGFSQIGIFGNGKPITSNPVTFTATGQSSTVIYAGSIGTLDATGNVIAGTGSQYLYTKDFTTTAAGSLLKLPYVPNSMVITLNGAQIFIGSSGGLISVTTLSNSVSAPNQAIFGEVLSVSPDGSTLVTTDPARGTVSLYSNTGALQTAYGGVATRAQWSPDNQTVYITLNTGEILSHGAYTDWQQVTTPQVYNDVAVTVPSVGAYFAGPSSADGRSYCSSTTNVTAGNPPTAANAFLPLADSDTAAIMDRIAATNDGRHMLGAHAPSGGTPTFTDMNVTVPIQACPAVIAPGYFTSAPFSKPLTTVSATSITGVVPSGNSAVAFVTYTGTSGLLPYYVVPTPGSFGSLQYLPLSSGTAPLSGVFSTDNSMFFVGTATDNLIHEILVTYPSTGAPTVVDSGTLTPALPSASGTGFAPANVVLQHPKKATS